MSKARAYCFTINNWTEEDITACLALSQGAEYLIYGKEKGDNGTAHLQGYVHFKSSRSFKAIKKALPRAHLEVAKGSPQSNIVYCSKGGEVTEYGSRPKMGERTDIDEVREQLRDGANMKQISNTATSYQSIKVAEVWLKYNEKPRTWKPEVRWYYGSTGSGKTKSAREWLGEDCYTTLDTGKWWEGYDGHESVLMDDFRKDFCKFHVLLKLLDRYEHRVEAKGGSRQLLAKKIAITTPYHPAVVYQTREDVKQLLRRIDEIILCGHEVSETQEPARSDFIDSDAE